jgi:transposase-like protein
MKESRRKFDEEYKKQIVQEYLSGNRSAAEIAAAEGLVAGQIYNWKTQLENRQRQERIEGIQGEQNVSPEQARRIWELEEELEAYEKKVAQLTLENDLLKKIHPNLAFEKRSSGYIDIKRRLGQRNGRVK